MAVITTIDPTDPHTIRTFAVDTCCHEYTLALSSFFEFWGTLREWGLLQICTCRGAGPVPDGGLVAFARFRHRTVTCDSAVEGFEAKLLLDFTQP